MKTFLPAWQETWDDLSFYIILLAIFIPWTYAGLIFEGDNLLVDIAKSNIHEYVHHKIYRFILWDPFICLSKNNVSYWNR